MSSEELLQRVESVLYLAVLHNNFDSIASLLSDVQKHNDANKAPTAA